MIDRSPLAPALKGDKQSLSKEAAAEIAALNGARPLAFTLELVWAWAVVFAVVYWATHAGSMWVSLLAICVVTTRQNVLGLLVHDQSHSLGYRGRHGDLLVDLFAAYPLLVLTVAGYAQVHLAHHRSYFTDQDPDFLRKSGEDWSIPMSPARLARLFVTDACGINTLKLVRGKSRAGSDPALGRRRHPVPAWVRPTYYVALAVLLTWAHLWGAFLLYWVLPILTVFQLVVRWGALCEHKYNLPGASVAESTPLIVLRWWERLLLPNLNFAMHPYHHYFPGVAFSNLPRIHAIYEREGLVNQESVFRGYWQYLRFITNRPSSPPSVPG